MPLISKELTIAVLKKSDFEFQRLKACLKKIPGLKFNIQAVDSIDKNLKPDILFIHEEYQDNSAKELISSCLNLKTPIIVLVDNVSNNKGKEYIKLGAADFLLMQKLEAPFLERAMRYALDSAKIEKNKALVDQEIEKNYRINVLKTILEKLNKKLIQNNEDLTELVQSLLTNLKTDSDNYTICTKALKLIKDQQDFLNNSFALNVAKNLRLDPVNIQEACLKSIEALQATTPPNVNITFEMDRSEVYEVTTNKEVLNEIILELCKNSFEAMPNGGNLILKLSKYNQAEQKLINLEIRDSGEGIESKNISSLFDPLFTTKSEKLGIGLGLCKCQILADAMNVNLEVTTNYGHGTTVNLLFNQDNKSVRSFNKLKGLAITVNSDQTLAKLTELYLYSVGLTTKIFSNGVNALDWYNKNHTEVNLFILELPMSDLNLKETVKYIKSLHPSLPIAISADYLDMDLKELTNQGLCHYFQKPHNYLSLVSWVSQTLK